MFLTRDDFYLKEGPTTQVDIVLASSFVHESSRAIRPTEVNQPMQTGSLML